MKRTKESYDPYGEGYRFEGLSDDDVRHEAEDDYDYSKGHYPESLKGKSKEDYVDGVLARHQAMTKRLSEYPEKEAAAKKLGKYEPEDLAELGFDENDYAKFHRTGFIDPSAYKSADDPDLWAKHDGSFVKDGHGSSGDMFPKEKNPVLRGVIATKAGRNLEVRSSGERLRYAKHDENDDIVRDPAGLAVYLSDEEIRSLGVPKESTDLYVYDGDQLVARAEDEWGADGVWVHPAYRGQGIGVELLRMFRKQFKSRGLHGQATPAGFGLYKGYFKRYSKPVRESVLGQLNTEDGMDQYEETWARIASTVYRSKFGKAAGKRFEAQFKDVFDRASKRLDAMRRERVPESEA